MIFSMVIQIAKNQNLIKNFLGWHSQKQVCQSGHGTLKSIVSKEPKDKNLLFSMMLIIWES